MAAMQAVPHKPSGGAAATTATATSSGPLVCHTGVHVCVCLVAERLASLVPAWWKLSPWAQPGMAPGVFFKCSGHRVLTRTVARGASHAAKHACCNMLHASWLQRIPPAFQAVHACPQRPCTAAAVHEATPACCRRGWCGGVPVVRKGG